MIDRACISITSKCQLRCKYCHFDKHISKLSCNDISTETLYNILSNIVAYSEENKINFKIGIVGAGEPLIRFDLIQEAVAHTRLIDKSKRLSFYTITNGIAATENIIRWFHNNRDLIKLCFSIDGDKNLHDSCRTLANGKGSFDIVMNSINLYKKIFLETPSVNATVHKRTLINKEETLRFFEQNFSEVCFSRLVDEKSPDLYISKGDFIKFIDAASQKKLLLRQLRTPKRYDCTMYGQLCGVGKTNIFYADNKIYPCGRFIGLPEYEIGEASDSLILVEKSMQSFKQLNDGECYFDKYLGDKK